MRSTTANLRPAKPTDRDRLVEINEAAWKTAYRGILDEDFLARLEVSPQRWSDRIASGQVLVSSQRRRVVGYATWGVAEDDVMTLKQMTERFDLRKLTASPAAINFAKLDHFNGTHIRALPDAELAQRVRPYFEKADLAVKDDVLLRVAPLIKERLTTLDEAPTMAGFFFRSEVAPQRDELMPKSMDAATATGILNESLSILEGLPSVAAEDTEPALRALVDRTTRPAGEVFGVLRVAVTGQKVSPPLFQSMEIIGRDTVLARLRAAVQMLAKPA